MVASGRGSTQDGDGRMNLGERVNGRRLNIKLSSTKPARDDVGRSLPSHNISGRHQPTRPATPQARNRNNARAGGLWRRRLAGS